MSSLKVALFTGNYNHIRDGVSLTLNRLVKFLEDAGVEVLVFGPTIDPPALEHQGRMIAVPSLSIPGRPEYRLSLSLPRDARIELEHFNPDIVHIATPDILGYKALKWARRNEKLIVASYHTHFTSYLKYYKLKFLEPVGWRYLRWFYQFCLHIYVPSPSMIETLKINGINGDMRIWARGVDSDRFSPAKRDDEWREKHGFEQDDIVVTFISRLVWEKNLKIFAETVKTVASRNSKLKALVVGDGPAMEGLKKLLPDAKYTGFLTGDELATAYASSDIFFFPSDTESFGNVTLEAMTSGLPCIVADAIGSKSLVEDGKNGYLIPVEDSGKFVSALESLASDENLRIVMGKKSLQLSGKYSWDQINGKLLSHYHEVIVHNTEHH
jgi:phosphatidylinositol alpha 1,6-mannosyltransferase